MKGCHIKNDRLQLHLYPAHEASNFPSTNESSLSFSAYRSDIKWLEKDIPQSFQILEETNYILFIQSWEGQIQLKHRDPNLLKSLHNESQGRVIHGILNFHSQIGKSRFQILLNGKPEMELILEVHPTKMDYASDYQHMVRDIQELVHSLVLAYLRATYQLGMPAQATSLSSQLEWLLLLRHVVDDLEKALLYIAQQPIKGLKRGQIATRAERVRNINPAIQALIQKGAGSGEYLQLGTVSIREHLLEHQACPTLDTPEHRWLAIWLKNIRQQLKQIRQKTTSYRPSDRQRQIISELDILENRITHLGQLDYLKEPIHHTLTGFASLQLLSAPGYREAYRYCLILLMGLQVNGEALSLSIKDLHQLYEYWCYLTLLRLVSELTDTPIPPESLCAVEQNGVYIRLKKGTESQVLFHVGRRRIQIRYNPRFHTNLLVPQQPDILLTLRDPDWPDIHLLMDAKYRVDTSPEYMRRYAYPGPPEDALNVLHRYRDAIMEKQDNHTLKRTIVQAVALFPSPKLSTYPFANSSLLSSLKQTGVGALPFLPGHTQPVRHWLKEHLGKGSWQLAEQAIGYQVQEQALDWKQAAQEGVLLGVLHPGEEENHWQWIWKRATYYMPLLKKQPRQLTVRWVAIYLPSPLKKPGAVTHYAPVKAIEIVNRQDIQTPWKTSIKGEKQVVIYQLGTFRSLRNPIINRENQRFSTPRWTSRLALARAQNLPELLLETLPEWQLYESLNARKISFQIKALSPKAIANQRGRASFLLPSGTLIRYLGTNGFLIETLGQSAKVACDIDSIFSLKPTQAQ